MVNKILQAEGLILKKCNVVNTTLVVAALELKQTRMASPRHFGCHFSYEDALPRTFEARGADPHAIRSPSNLWVARQRVNWSVGMSAPATRQESLKVDRVTASSYLVSPVEVRSSAPCRLNPPASRLASRDANLSSTARG